jgi:Ca-activated chloride channel family protein
MRKIAIISLLLSLSILVAEPLRAQKTRPRQVERSQSPQAAPTPPQSNDESEEIDEGDIVRVNTTLVTVPVNVTDQQGKYVGNLRQQDFRIYEDGVQQEIAYFASVDKPFIVALLLDASSSTRFKLEEIQAAAIAFLDQLRPDDKVMVVTFNSKVEVLSEPTSDRNALRAAILRAKPARGTFLYRAVDFAITQRLNQTQGRKAIVLFTDGIDSTSKHEAYENNIREAEGSDVLIYPIQYATSMRINNQRRTEMKEQGDAYLHDVAQKTGARYFSADTPQNLSQAFAFIAEELRRQYSLGYYPKRQAQAGQRRQIAVKVNRPGLIVHARDSYVYHDSTRTGVAQDKER